MDKRLEAIISLLAEIAVERYLKETARPPPEKPPKKRPVPDKVQKLNKKS